LNILSEKKLDNAVVEFEIEVPAETVAEEYKQVFSKIQRRVAIDGFRKGKAPLQIVEVKYNDYAGEEVAENLVRRSVVDALEKTSHIPIAEPRYSYDTIDKNSPFKFKAFIEVMPSIEIGDYKGIEAKEYSYTIKEEDVDFEIDAIRERYAEIEPAGEDAVVEKGNLVSIRIKRIDETEGDPDAVGFREYSSVIGKTKDEYSIENQVIGMKAGEERKIKQTYPESFPVKEFAGKEVEFLVQIKGINKLVLPELNDEFASKVGYKSVEEMRSKIRENLEKYVKDKTINDARSAVMAGVVKNTKFDIPTSMVLKEMSAIFERTQQRMGYRAESLEEFAEIMGLDPQEYAQRLKEAAELSIKHTLVLNEVSKKENLTVSEDKFKSQINELAKAMGKTPEEIEKAIEENNSKESVENEILLEMAMDFLYDNAKITKVQLNALTDLVNRVEEQS